MPQAPTLSRLSDSELVTEVARLVECERAATADLIAALVAFDERRLYLAEGFSSLFAYCVGRLRLSEGAAYLRIEAARAAGKFPLVLDRLRSGKVTLTTVKLLAPHLTDANVEDVLDAAAGKTKLEVEELVARLAPRPDVRTSVRKLPERREVAAARTELPREEGGGGLTLEAPDSDQDGQAAKGPGSACTHAQLPARPAVVRPLSPARYQLQVTMSGETHAKFRRLQELLRREIPSGDAAAIVDRALTVLLEQVERQKLAAIKGRRRQARGGQGNGDEAIPVGRRRAAAAATREVDAPHVATTAMDSAPSPPGRSRPSPSSRAIPAAIKREVLIRDQGQCTYVSATGQRCGGRSFLEFHHQEPFADGGPATVSNVRILCRAHHSVESERVFGWRRERENSVEVEDRLGGTGSGTSSGVESRGT